MVKYVSTSAKARAYLAERDPLLGEYMAVIGPVKRPRDPDLFSALINTIIGQQISGKAHKTVWERFANLIGEVTPEKVARAEHNQIQACGLSHRKTEYIQSAAEKAAAGELNLARLPKMTDHEVIQTLIQFKGIGEWSAEMLLLFSLGRADILSYEDLGIHRGLCVLHRPPPASLRALQKLTKAAFEEYRTLYSPYGSAASLYLWAIAGGAGPE
jgi:DNA-3-methyladenine glycosylase II